MSTSSEPVGAFASQPIHHDPMDIVKPVRSWAEDISCAPVRALRCVGQREIAGEGLCYIYEDGTYCRAVIDGEPANPSWGVTKAGKPRKRLAQACLTCREKKIKCEPGYPKCRQCAKSQRACRGSVNEPSTNNASRERLLSSSVIFKDQSSRFINSLDSHNKSRPLDEPRDPTRRVESWTATSTSPFKHQKFQPTSVATSGDKVIHSVDLDWSSSLNSQGPDDPRRSLYQDQLAFQWEQDPYKTDAYLTLRLLDLYFLHLGCTTHGMFPRQPFLIWVETDYKKTLDQLMLLYSVLAMGSIFSNDKEEQTRGKWFSAVATYATQRRFGQFTLQLCQSRLVLALYNFARGNAQEAWDFCGAGLRALSALKINTEEGVKELPDTILELDYGFNRRTLEECCRRTFWSGFFMDRYSRFFAGTLCVINPEDAFIRLPCLETAYEASAPIDNTPFFGFEILSRNTGASSFTSDLPNLGHMAHLILISAIWGEVLTYTSRAVHRPDNDYERFYETFYSETYHQLDTWLAMLPSNLRYSRDNLNNSIIRGDGGIFLSLHALYHTSIIWLNRHARIRAFMGQNLTRNIGRLFRSASHFFGIMRSLAPAVRQQQLPPAASDLLFSTPFPGYAFMLCVDVISSSGSVSTLPSLISTLSVTLTNLKELGMFWASTHAQLKAVSNRVCQLTEIAMKEEQNARNGRSSAFWKVRESLETMFAADDIVYGAEDYNKQHADSANLIKYEEIAAIYTREPGLLSTTKKSFICEFARLLSESLGPGRDKVELIGSIYSSVEELLRSFALRLACGGSSQEILRLVAFIHRHCRIIAEAFKNLFPENTDNLISSPPTAEGMNFLEKVSTWAISSQDRLEAPTGPEYVDIDEGSGFDTLYEEDEQLPEVSIYRKLIGESDAYQWLLAQLRHKTILSTPSPDVRKTIRNTILCALPEPPRISRMGNIELVKATYIVQWDVLAFLRGQYKEELGYAVENAITLTGSVEHTQAETCIGYLKQTWPLTGEYLVQLLKRVVQTAEGTHQASNAGDGTLLTARIESRKFIVTASGSRDSIADVGEQLAWLGSSLQHSPTDRGPVFCIAEMHQVRSRKVHALTATDPSVEMACTIRFENRPTEDQKQPAVMNGKCWHDLFLNPVIAMGFPIPSRDESQVGLEIPLYMMARLAQAKRVTSFNGKLCAKGFSTMLFPTKRSGNIISWHLLYNKNRQRLTYKDPRIRPLQDSSVDSIGINELEHSRHILGWASPVEIVTGAIHANYNIRRSGYASREASCVLEKVSISAGKVVNAGASLAIGLKDVPLHLKREGSYIEQIQDAYNNYVILYDADDKRAWLVNGATALLHIVRASLHESINGKFHSHVLFKPAQLKEAPITNTSDSAIGVLTCDSNMELKIFRDKAELWTETTKSEDGSTSRVIEKRKERFVYFQDIVDQKWHILEQLLDQQSQTSASGMRLTVPGRQYLEGFEFTDVASRISDLQPKATRLQACGKGWVDFTRSIRAITLFGRGFGELIRPAKDCTNLCNHWSNVPKGMDYLVVSVSDLEEISKRRGNPDATPMRLVGDICWHKPDRLFEPCHCKGNKLKRNFSGLTKTCDRVQVLIPSTSRVRRFISPGPLYSMRQGAVIFGHSRMFPLRWGDHGEPKEGEPTPPPEEPESDPNDSGLGSSLPSSTS